MSNNIEISYLKKKTKYIAFDKGKFTLVISYPFTRLGKNLTKMFYKRMERKQMNKKRLYKIIKKRIKYLTTQGEQFKKKNHIDKYINTMSEINGIMFVKEKIKELE